MAIFLGAEQQAGAHLAGVPDAAARRTPARALRRRWLLGAIAPALLVALWWLSSATGWANPALLPSPGRVATAGWSFFFGDNAATLPGVVRFDGAGWSHLSASLTRWLSAFAAAAIVGFVVGLALGRSARVAALLDPLVNALRAVPLYAWLPIMLVWFGIGENAARALIFLGALWPVLIATADGVARVSRAHVETARMLGTRRRDLWRRVHLPAALPEIVTGLRLSLTLSWMTVIVAELTGTSTGVGAMMNAARETANIAQIVVGMVVFASIGLLADVVLRRSSRRFTRWAAS